MTVSINSIIAGNYRGVDSKLPKNTIAVLGTSIEQQVSDGPGGVNPTVYYARGAVVAANGILGSPFSAIGNYGVSGDTSGPQGANPGMTTRVSAIITGGYGWCFVGFPINDLTNGAGANVDTFTIPNMLSIYTQLLAAGINVIAGDGGPTSTLANVGGYANNYAKVQTAIRGYVAANAGIVLANTAIAMTNPVTGLPFTSPASTIDGTHDNCQGASLKAQAIVNVLSPLVKGQDTSLSNPFDAKNYAINPFGLNDNISGVGGFTAAGVTGTGPSGWSARVRGTGAAVGSRAPVRTSTWKQPTQGARLALTATASFDGAIFYIGGDDLNGTIGRYDLNWAALTAYTIGIRRIPTAGKNGYSYVATTAGTTGAGEPTWLTTEGSFIVDGTVTWMVQKYPVTGDQFYAMVEVETSGLTAGKGAMVILVLRTQDNTGLDKDQVLGNYADLSGNDGVPGRYLAPSQRIITPTFTVGAYQLRYLIAQVYILGEAGSTVNMDVFRVNINRV